MSRVQNRKGQPLARLTNKDFTSGRYKEGTISTGGHAWLATMDQEGETRQTFQGV